MVSCYNDLDWRAKEYAYLAADATSDAALTDNVITYLRVWLTDIVDGVKKMKRKYTYCYYPADTHLPIYGNELEMYVDTDTYFKLDEYDFSEFFEPFFRIVEIYEEGGMVDRIDEFDSAIEKIFDDLNKYYECTATYRAIVTPAVAEFKEEYRTLIAELDKVTKDWGKGIEETYDEYKRYDYWDDY